MDEIIKWNCFPRFYNFQRRFMIFLHASNIQKKLKVIVQLHVFTKKNLHIIKLLLICVQTFALFNVSIFQIECNGHFSWFQFILHYFDVVAFVAGTFRRIDFGM